MLAPPLEGWGPHLGEILDPPLNTSQYFTSIPLPMGENIPLLVLAVSFRFAMSQLLGLHMKTKNYQGVKEFHMLARIGCFKNYGFQSF